MEVTYLRALTYPSAPARAKTSNLSPFLRHGSASPRLASPLTSRSKVPVDRKSWDVLPLIVSAPPVARMMAVIAKTIGPTSTPHWGWADPLLARRTGRVPRSSVCAWTHGWHKEHQPSLQSPASQGEGWVRHGDIRKSKGPLIYHWYFYSTPFQFVRLRCKVISHVRSSKINCQTDAVSLKKICWTKSYAQAGCIRYLVQFRWHLQKKL